MCNFLQSDDDFNKVTSVEDPKVQNWTNSNRYLNKDLGRSYRLRRFYLSYPPNFSTNGVG